MLLVRTPINVWPSFHKNETVRFREIPISSSCFLSEVDHIDWMTCSATSTRAGCWRPENRFHVQNIGFQSFWDNFFTNCKNENSTDLVLFFCLSFLSNGSQDRLPSPFFMKRCSGNDAHALSDEPSVLLGKFHLSCCECGLLSSHARPVVPPLVSSATLIKTCIASRLLSLGSVYLFN